MSIPRSIRGNAPPSQVDAQGVPDTLFFGSGAFQGDTLGGQNLIFVGRARPGALKSDPVWQIQELTWDAFGNVIAIQWPSLNGIQKPTNGFQYVWDDRLTYTFS